jgi:predicted NAD-dependent protein-ADP-ribosyltransferase YbiA (DUF1768 family)
MWQKKEYEYVKNLENQEDIDKYFTDQAKFYFKKKKMEQIDNFNGDFAFLNNEYPCDVYFEGKMYPNVYNAFQAARTTGEYFRTQFQKSLTITERFELSKQIRDPVNWESRRLIVMETLLRDKFRRHRDLRVKLANTGRRELVNSYNDVTVSNLFWGMVKKQGQNQLGIILSTIRQDIQGQKDLDKWVQFCTSVQRELKLLPELTVYSKCLYPLEKLI